MTDILTFNNPEFGSIRSIEQNGEPWFVGKDVALALGYKDTVNALKSHVDEQDKAGWRITTQFGEKETTSVAVTRQVRTIDADDLQRYLGHLPDREMSRLDAALRRALGV